MKKFFLFFFFLSTLCANDFDLPDGYEPDTFDGISETAQSKEPREKLETPAVNIFETIPSAVVAGCVNAISGDYFETHLDLVTPGPAPLLVQRSWSSADKKWHFSHMPKLNVGYSKGGSKIVAGYEGDLGSGMQFRVHKDDLKGNNPFKPAKSLFKEGVTNCAMGEISGQTNWKNSRILPVKKGEKKHLFLQHGTRVGRIFKNIEKKGKQHGVKLGKYQLIEERHPDGNAIAYSYNSRHELRSLISKNRDQEILATLSCQPLGPSKKRWESFSGKVEYHFADLKERQLLFADLSQTPSAASQFTRYQYDSKKRIIRQIKPLGQSLWISYKKGKVKELIARASEGAGPYATHRFEYGSDGLGKYAKVYDAEGNLTLYRSKKKRLAHIYRYVDGKAASRESFQWTDQGNLISRSLSSDKKVIARKEFEYDPYGNITKEILKGNLTGNAEEESHIKTFLSSKDGWNLPLEENDGRKTVRFSYYPKSNQLKSRLTIASGLIVKREFFQYDINGTLIEEIVDDGASENPEDLTGATERHRKRITPSKEYPIGLPEKVEEHSLDLAANTFLHLRTTAYTYSPQGKPIEERRYDQKGNLAYTLYREYDQQGNLAQETDPLGQPAFASYDQNSNKISEAKEGVSKIFTYDLQNQLIKEEEIWADGTHLTATFRYNKLNQKIAAIDTHGNETTYVYDPLGRLAETHYPPIETSQGKWVRPIEKTRYDAMGNPIEKQDPLNHSTRQRFTVYGKPYWTQEPNGAVSRKEYTTDGLLSKETAPNGVATTYTRDYLGRVLLEEAHAPDGALLKSKSSTYNAFHLLSEKDEEGVETTYHYDPFGRLSSKTRKEKTIEYRYDPLGRTHQTIHWIDQKTAQVRIQEHDLLDRVIEERTEDLNGTVFQKTTYSYDQAGNPTHITVWTENGSSTHMTEYTPHGKPKLQIDPEGKETHIYYTFNKYQEARTVDPLGNQTIEVQNYQGKLIEEKTLDPFGEVIRKKQNYYDPCSRLAAWHITVYQGNQPIEEQIVHWRYDCMGNEVQCIEGVGTPEEKTTFHTYNSLNQKISTLTPKKTSLDQQYDLLGRKVELRASDGTVHYTYTYDLKDRPVKVQDPIHQTENRRVYDGHGRLLKEVLDNGGVIGYAYDALDRVTTLSLPDQNRIEYHYDPANLKKIERYRKDQLLYTHHYLEYDNLQPTLEQLPGNAGQRAHQRDLQNRLIKCTTPCTQETLFYDPVGNLIRRESTDPIGRLSYTYQYDALYQLVHETGSRPHTYGNDSILNRREKDGAVYQVNALNQLKEEGGRAYAYDANGCLIGSGDKQYTYDALGRLTHVQDANGRTDYCYDAFHRRTCKSANGIAQMYLYQGQSEIGALSNGEIKQLRVLGKGIAAEIGGAVAFELGDETYVPIYDSSGNVTTLLTLDGGPVQSYRYSAFGEQHESFGKIENPWKFSSKRFDPETGFYEFGRRYYFPEVGRWISPDPAGFEDGANLYAYAQNSPLIYIDPDGQLAFLIPIAINIALSMAAEYALPMAIATLEQYSGGLAAASLLSGFVNGYNGNYTSSNFGHDINLGFYEKAGMAVGTALSLNPKQLVQNGIKSAVSSELKGRACHLAASKGSAAIQWCAANTARQSAKQIAKTSVEKTSEIALRKGVVKSVADASRGSVVKQLDLDALSKAGKVMDRGGLTKAGRSLDKHGNRPGSVFPKATGNSIAKNRQGQFQLDDILTNPKSIIEESFRPRYGGEVIDIKIPGNRGLRYNKNGEFIGFLNP